MFRAADYRQLIRLFSVFVIPSVGSQLLSGIYTIVDGFFIGMGVGEHGLAAVGLAFPFTVFVTAVGSGIGVGGGALMSMSLGRKRKKLAERILGSMVLLMTVASLITVVVFTSVSRPLLSLYGVSSDVAAMSFLYAKILFLGSPAQVVTMGMLGAVRNSGSPRKAMYIMVMGFLLNIGLDWLWVIAFPYGIAGAAWATVVSQMLTAVLLSLHFVSGKSNVRFKKSCIERVSSSLCLRVISMGMSPFGVQIASAVTMVMHNWQALAYGGDIGVAAYAVIGYIVPVGIMLEEGIAEGIQPLVSFYHGAGLFARRKITARIGFISAIALGIVCSLFIYFSCASVPNFFSMEGEAAEVAARGLKMSVFMFPFLGTAKVGASYFQAIGKLRSASLLTYGDPFVLLPLFLWVLPLFFGLDGVWLAMTFANIALCAVFVLLWSRESQGGLLLPEIDAWRRL
jgi:putative MATE family efflux protein